MTLEKRVAELEKALEDACDNLLMLSIKGSNELPGVEWGDLETPIPISVEQLTQVLETRRKEAHAAWRKAVAVLRPLKTK